MKWKNQHKNDKDDVDYGSYPSAKTKDTIQRNKQNTKRITT